MKLAISNNRIKSIDNGQANFEYKDRADNGTIKTQTISAHEFIRRFLLHVLPHNFMKIRYFGFLSHRNKKQAVALRRIAWALGVPMTKCMTRILETSADLVTPVIICEECKKRDAQDCKICMIKEAVCCETRKKVLPVS